MGVDERGSDILPRPDCLRLLATASKDGLVGRLGVSTQEAPVIQPVNFAYRDRRIVLRLGRGLMADAAAGALVAFEVDHLDRKARVAWSVLARGLATPLEEFERLGETYIAPTPLVPTPGDTILVIRLELVTGRRFRLDNVTPDTMRRHPTLTSSVAKTPTGLRETIGAQVPPP